MQLTPKTKLLELIGAYPFLTGFLADYAPRFAGLRNPLLLKTMARTASLGKIAAMGGVPVDELLMALRDQIASEAGETVEVSIEGMPLTRQDRREVLKQIIKDLHAGKDRDEVKARFNELIEDVGASEIGEMEQELIEAGMPQSEITKLCDVHLEIFHDVLSDQPLPDVPPGHPVHTFMAENTAFGERCSELLILAERLANRPTPSPELLASIDDALADVSQIDVHYIRKENQLFPYLEKHGISGPPQVMWTTHDEIRAELKAARKARRENDIPGFVAATRAAVPAMRSMIEKENLILWPMALETLTDEEWIEMHEGEGHIGYALVEPEATWPAAASQRTTTRTPDANRLAAAPDATGFASVLLNLQTGALTPEQANLLFNHLPVEISFTDEQHRVCYFSEGKERIFPRSPAVIGRHVEQCHPPKSVHMVKEILAAFENGERDVAEFWLELGGKFIYIRYFAVRDAGGVFRGTMEVVQDVTAIRQLSGSRTLLQWE